jgi:flagellar biosynthetic protein FliR
LSASALSQDWIAAFLLVATRFGALALMAPPLGGRAVPAQVRMAVVMTLSACFASQAQSHMTPGWTLAHFSGAAATEVGLGATMAFGLNLAVGAFTIGARLIDTQVGFGIGQVVDPTTRRQMPILTGLYTQVALVVLVSAGALEGIVQGFAIGLERIPPGRIWSVADIAPEMMREVSSSFALGFAIAAPVVLALLLIDLALGVISRSLPQMNMFAMGLPIKVLAGIAALAVWAPSSLALMSRTYATVFQGWSLLFR